MHVPGWKGNGKRLLARHGMLIDNTMDLMATGCKIINCIKL